MGRDADGFLATKALGLVSLDTSPFCIAEYPVQQSGSDLVGFVGHVSSVPGASGRPGVQSVPECFRGTGG